MRLLGSRVLMGLGLAAAASVALPARKAMAGIAVDPTSSVTAEAGDFELGGTRSTDAVAYFPYSNTTSAFDPNAASMVLLNADNTGFGTTFSAIITGAYSMADGKVDILFTPSSDLAYSLSGNNTATGDALYHGFSASLDDISTKTSLFNNDQESNFVTNETLTLGNQAGNETNALSGNLSGTLTAGDTYELQTYAEVDGQQPFFSLDDAPFSVAALSMLSGSGSVTMSLGSPSAVPAPPAAWMGLVTLAAIGITLKLRRRPAGALA